ncbi:hypothetical protein HK405_006485 [Cladochytrium tenue]|nr:hypothetical protein HK405_006485 [Cladochytrium tenue]
MPSLVVAAAVGALLALQHAAGTVSAASQTAYNVAVGASASASGYTQTYTPANAVDGDVSTYWESTDNALPQWLHIDLGASYVLDHITLALPSAWGSRTQTIAVAASADGNAYSALVASATYSFTAGSNAVNLTFASVTSRHLNLTFTANSAWPAGQLSELMVFGYPANPTVGANAALGKTVTASGYTQAYVPSNAVDGDQSTYWESTDNAFPQTLQVDLAASKELDHLVLRLPTSWGSRTQTLSVDGSLDGSTFQSIASSATYTFTANASTNAVSIAASNAAARYVRLTFTANSAWPAGQVSELEVYPIIASASSTSTSASSSSTTIPSSTSTVVSSTSSTTSASSSSSKSTSVASSSSVSTTPIATPTGVGATVPYFRYDTADATTGGGAVVQSAPTFDQSLTASEASEQSYISLPTVGSYAQWTIRASHGGDGVTMRFTMPDSSDGTGLTGMLAVLVNGAQATTVNVSSYWSWQYYSTGGGLYDAPTSGASPFFRFDEVHFQLGAALKAGDTVAIMKAADDGIVYGVDFLEIESVPAEVPMPAGAVSVTSYGAVADDGSDDLAAFNAAWAAAVAQGVPLYIPRGTWQLSNMWVIGSTSNYITGHLTITGAGMWHTNLQFTSPNQASGGISFRVTGSVDFSNVHMNSRLRSRYNENAVYKGLMDNFGTGSTVSAVWIEHFECGMWVGDYSQTPALHAEQLKVRDSRIRNNLADGINFSQGTSDSLVTNCSMRNNGDDSLAVWPSNTNAAPMGVNNNFVGNTIENNWRASGIGIFGGSGHSVLNNMVVDCFASPGIRFTTDFPGYQFQSNTGITVSGNTVVRCGTSADMFGQERGQVDLAASGSAVSNLHFSGTTLLSGQRNGVQMGYSAGFNNIVFDNTVIDGTGLDGVTSSVFSSPHAGAAIFVYTGTGSATFNNLTTSNIAYAGVNDVQSGFVLTIN